MAEVSDVISNGSDSERRLNSERRYRRDRSDTGHRSSRRRGHSYRGRSRSSRSHRRGESRRYRSRSYSRRDRRSSVSRNRSRRHNVESATRRESERQDSEERRRKEFELRRKKEIEEAQREDLTVLVINLHLRVDERDIYELFSEHAGKVRDIQCVKDLRSGKSKGVAYVEFYTQEAVIKALSMSGFDLKGQRIRVQSSQAEKNRAAKAAKMLEKQALDAGESPFTIFVGGLVGSLASINESELKQLFSPFGTIIDAEIHRDSSNSEPRGYAFLKFKRSSEAKEAMAAMNGFEIGGQQIKVGYASAVNSADGMGRLSTLGDGDIERLDDDGGGLISGATNKIALMQKLQRGSEITPKTAPSTVGYNVANGYAASTTTALAQPVATNNLILSNMFSSNDLALSEPNFFDEIEEDVREECNKYGKVVGIYLNRRLIDGKVWVKFQNSADASVAYKGLDGRFFAGNTIKVEYTSDEVWNNAISH